MNIIILSRRESGVSVKTLAKAIQMPIPVYVLKEMRLAFTNTQYEVLCKELGIDYDDYIYL